MKGEAGHCIIPVRCDFTKISSHLSCHAHNVEVLGSFLAAKDAHYCYKTLVEWIHL